MSSSGGKKLEFVWQNNRSIPVRSILFSYVPPATTHKSLTQELQAIYRGPVDKVQVMIKPRRPNQPNQPRQPPSKFAVVEFRRADTASVVLGEPKQWSDGHPIDARPAKTQPEPPRSRSELVYGDESRLRRLNDDCLMRVCDYLPFWATLRLSESSSQMRDFVTEHIVPKYAHKCTLFVVANRGEYCQTTKKKSDSLAKPIDLKKFECMIRFLAPKLTHLSLNSFSLSEDLSITDKYLRTVFEHCRSLVSLQLFMMHINKAQNNADLLDGTVDMTHLKELLLWYNLCSPNLSALVDFIDQLTGLETLVFMRTLIARSCDQTSWPTMMSIAAFKQKRPLSLRRFCVSGHFKLYRPMVMEIMLRSRNTLRELWLHFHEMDDNSQLYLAIAKHLPLLESLYVRPLPVEVEALNRSLATMRHLRRIIVHLGTGPSTDWMRRLAAGPNRVEHLQMWHTSIEHQAEVWANLGSFGAQVRVLELRGMKFTTDRSMAHFSGLHTLRLVECSYPEHILLTAIRQCAGLRHVIFRRSTLDVSTLPRLIAALQTVVDAELFERAISGIETSDDVGPPHRLTLEVQEDGILTQLWIHSFNGQAEIWDRVGHTLRRGDNNIARQAVMWNPQESRPRNTWRRTVIAESKAQRRSWGEVCELANKTNAVASTG